MENAIQPTPPLRSGNETAAGGAQQQDLTGRSIGDFRILRRLGQGGMGQVYLAKQISLNRDVALKIMRPDLAANAVALERFRREAEAVARITHANIVQVYAYGQAEGLYYMALEYIEGKNLREYIAKKGPPELAQALSIMRQVAAGLQRASELGIVHRDIKPENILLARKGEVKVADFGLSRAFGGDAQPANLTQSGVAMGTPLYMSPEQVQGKGTDPRTDIYSFGVTCYHMFTGQPPFRGASAIEVAIQHVQNTAKPLQEIRPDLPIEVCQVVHKMMMRDPAKRYQTAQELIEDIRQLREGLSSLLGQGAESGVRLGQSVGSSVRLAKGALAAPVSSVKLALGEAPPSSQRRGVWIAASLFLTLLLAAAAGGTLRLWREKQRPAPVALEPPVVRIDDLREPPGPSPQELALVEAAKKPFPRTEEERRKHVDNILQLAGMYLEQQRFSEADALFTSMPEKLGPYVAVMSRAGHAVVLAYQNKADESVAHLLKLDEGKPGLDAMLFRYVRMRRLVGEALDRDAANLAPKKLPDALERFRRAGATVRPSDKGP